MRISDWSSDVCSSDLYRFGNINFLTEHNIVDGTGEDVDFSYSQVPADFGAWFQVLDPSGVVQHEEPRAEFDFARYEPDPHQTFAFAGQVRTQILSSDRKSTRLNYSH